mmetsp:Transcript_17840/g.31060  ORF Transcript_17840/g.31060 Transcript_17840/m.31060 type:complete len:286 (-) Transcript_17840:1054-1911(-)
MQHLVLRHIDDGIQLINLRALLLNLLLLLLVRSVELVGLDAQVLAIGSLVVQLPAHLYERFILRQRLSPQHLQFVLQDLDLFLGFAHGLAGRLDQRRLVAPLTLYNAVHLRKLLQPREQLVVALLQLFYDHLLHLEIVLGHRDLGLVLAGVAALVLAVHAKLADDLRVRLLVLPFLGHRPLQQFGLLHHVLQHIGLLLLADLFFQKVVDQDVHITLELLQLILQLTALVLDAGHFALQDLLLLREGVPLSLQFPFAVLDLAEHSQAQIFVFDGLGQVLLLFRQRK